MSIAEDFLNVFYGNDDFTNFTAQLLRLIAKADPFNLEKLSKGFPFEVLVFRMWQSMDRKPTRDEILQWVERAL